MNNNALNNLKLLLGKDEPYQDQFPWLSENALITYAIVDAAQHEHIWPNLLDLRPEHRCLYRGPDANALAEVAPYLVEIKPTETFTEWFIQEGYGNHWGCFLFSKQPIDPLSEHLKRFVKTRNSDTGAEEFIRFYDPRVWEDWLITLGKERTAEIAGEVCAYCFQMPEGPDHLRIYRAQPEKQDWWFTTLDLTQPPKTDEKT